MRLKNKKTGEIGNLLPYGGEDGKIWVWIDNKSRPEYRYNSLAELNDEWEDYEEPKEYYYLNEYLELDHEMWTGTEFDNKLEAIGNYFETKEEAEKAVEKLKAFKRLKDKGFEFCCDIKYENLCGNGFNIPINAIMPPEAYIDTEVNKDLDLLFSGGEE